MKHIFILLLVVVTLASCHTNEQLVYLQNAGQLMPPPQPGDIVKVPDPVIKVGDLLTITVNTTTPEAAMPFNLPLVPTLGMTNYNVSRNTVSNYSGGLQNYIVGTEGAIVLPVIGTIQVVGLTKSELARQIKAMIYPKYITEEPIVLIRYANYHVSILGEVARPGNYTIDNDKVSIFEALALAGDLTIYGRRENVLLVRENENGRETIRIDLRDKNLLNSPYYFLQQSDVLYVQPNDPKSRASALSTAETLSVSLIGTLISLTSLIVNITK
jgi:polysaccharide export outer membrane protein